MHTSQAHFLHSHPPSFARRPTESLSLSVSPDLSHIPLPNALWVFVARAIKVSRWLLCSSSIPSCEFWTLLLQCVLREAPISTEITLPEFFAGLRNGQMLPHPHLSQLSGDSQEMLGLLVWGLHFENHWTETFLLDTNK